MTGFITAIPIMLPCPECSAHANAYIQKRMPEMTRIVSGRNELFKFYVDFHNEVNKRLRKPTVSYDKAYAMYGGGADVQTITYA